MRSLRLAAVLGLLATIACQPQAPATVSIIDGQQLRLLATNQRVPKQLLAQAGVLLTPQDQVLYNGYAVGLDMVLPASPVTTLQVRRAVRVTVNGDNHTLVARTVGEALASLGQPLFAADGISPSAGTFIGGPLAVQHTPSQPLTIRVGDHSSLLRSAASTVGTALAAAGLPLIGMDFSKPGENEPLPADGNIQLVRVSESITLSEKALLFQNKYEDSPNVALGEEKVTQPGVEGLSVTRVRIRYEDGQEVSRQTESETVVRPPQDRITARGTKIEIKTATINGVTIQYWRQMQMYATIYSPCNSGGSGCSSGTASGLPAGRGVVAVDPALYAYLNGQHLYIPGYGRAVIGDIGGGYIVEQNVGVSRYRWIDLGFDDNNIVDMTGWVTVYFLAPAPASIPDILK